MKITLGVPTTGSMKNDAVISLVGIVGCAEWDTLTILERGCYVHENRERIVKQAIDSGSSHLFFLDSDMSVPADTVIRLLAHEKPIVGANYNQRGFPLASTVKFANENGDLIKVPVEQFPTELFQCYAIATGCMLIDLKVFDQIEKPWFFFDEYRGEIMGEDVWFCRQAFRAKIPVYCDPTIQARHIGDYAY